ncbi:hypothetical protein AV521_44765 [Streptomyces sp. IMTB 2501]|nr:hypothetical protein AV521_44765 [Streptomyces sp. IMTB 2501]
MGLFRGAVLGADPERLPTPVHFARDIHPLTADHRATFEEILAAPPAQNEAGVSTITPEENEQRMGLFRSAVLGADPEHLPTPAHIPHDIHPLTADHRATFEEILAARLVQIGAGTLN